ncbi:MAG TPA: PDZ domain-containing protein [Deltaproteobacteria bacterium]|nr:PDZ domain-containing protein [Deltaproteobacteria bacterium]
MAQALWHLCTQLQERANLACSSIAGLCPIWAALLLMSACSTAGGLLPPPSERPGPAELHVGAVVETATGNVIGMDELIGKLPNVSVVYVGEMHTSAEDHKIQLAILQKLSQGGRCVELAMEMFPVTAQPVLDRYVREEMSQENFLKEVGWEEVWGFPFSLYRDLIDWQKQKRMPIIGLNAPNKVVRKIAHNGLGSLKPDERSQVAREFHLDDPANRDRIRKEYTVHEKDAIKDFQSFFEAQLAWEETMAQTLAERLDQTGGKCKIVVAIGEGHIRGRLGVPYLARLRKPHEYCTVAPVPIDYPSSTLDPNLADYIVITDKSEPFHRPRLGVAIQPAASGRGVEILAILPDTPAAAAHLRKGDIIHSVNGSPVKSVEEVQQALARGGSDHKVLIERDHKNITVTVTIGQ